MAEESTNPHEVEVGQAFVFAVLTYFVGKAIVTYLGRRPEEGNSAVVLQWLHGQKLVTLAERLAAEISAFAWKEAILLLTVSELYDNKGLDQL